MGILFIALGIIFFIACLGLVGVSLWFVFESGTPAGWWMMSTAGAWLMWTLTRHVLGI